jgi:glyoxylase-like metal-dependent hydrolase (beta-lactamase superfamily II)
LINRQPSLRILALIVLLGNLLSACTKQAEQPQGSDAGNSGESVVQTTGVVEQDIPWPAHIEPAHVEMALQQISQRTYYVEGPPGTPTDNEGFMSNAGVVITSEGVVLFDALGTPSLAYKFYHLLRQVTDKPVVKVVVSHYHADHIYGLQVFKDMGAEIIAPVGASDYLASDAAEGRLKQRRESLFPWVDENTRVVKPDRYIEKDTELHVGDVKLKLIMLGSTHSHGDLMMQVEPDQVLFSGDLIFEGRVPFVAGSNPDLWLQHLQKMDVSRTHAIVPGHGTASKNPQQALAFTRGYLEFLHQSMGDAVDNLTSFDEAYTQTDWSQYENLPAFVANRMNAYFIYLRLEANSIQ